MPRLTILSLRAALIFLLSGFTLGALLLANKGQPFAPQIWGLLPPHIEFLVVGWTVQMALAVAFWILPRFPGGSRGDERLATASIFLLNVGVLFVVAQSFTMQSPWPFLLLAGRFCQILSGILFALHAWGRVRPLY